MAAESTSYRPPVEKRGVLRFRTPSLFPMDSGSRIGSPSVRLADEFRYTLFRRRAALPRSAEIFPRQLLCGLPIARSLLFLGQFRFRQRCRPIAGGSSVRRMGETSQLTKTEPAGIFQEQHIAISFMRFRRLG